MKTLFCSALYFQASMSDLAQDAPGVLCQERLSARTSTFYDLQFQHCKCGYYGVAPRDLAKEKKRLLHMFLEESSQLPAALRLTKKSSLFKR
jgi:hypothetical protein